MFFDSLHISNFGPFSDLECRLSPTRINLISGSHESGQTQLVGAMLFALSGIECIRQEGRKGSRSHVQLIIREGDVSQTLVRDAIGGESLTEEFRVTTRSDHGLVSQPFHELLVRSLKDPSVPSLIFRGLRPISLQEIKAVMRTTVDEWPIQTDADHDFWAHIKTVASSVGPIKIKHVLSAGERLFLVLAAEVLRRQRAIDSIPLILDNPFGMLDRDILERSCRLLVDASRQSQILLLSSRSAELVELLGDNAIVHDWLELPRPRHFSQISYRYGFLQQSGVAQNTPKRRKVHTPTPTLIVTEGKTDWKHLKAALARLRASGMYKDLEVSFWEYGDDVPMGSGESLSCCMRYARIPQLRPVIWVFDRDEPAIVKQVCGQDGNPKSWGNKVFSFAIPIPDHRFDTPDICIEFYYKDEDIMRVDPKSRRLFLSNEFSNRTGRHKINKSLVCSDTRRLQRLTIVDDCVFDEEERNVALTKNAFAENILRGEEGFQDIDISAFARIFDTIATILLDVED